MLANDKQRKSFKALFEKGRKLTYKKGELIIRANETPTGVFLIESGLVKAYDITKYGEENLLIIRKAGEIFPLIWSVTGEDKLVVYEAMSQVEIWKVDRDEYLDYLQNNKEALPPFIDLVIAMYRMHSLRIINLEYRTVRERVVAFLLLMAERFGEESGSKIVISAPLRRIDIASSVNATRETTGREIVALERNKLIETNNSIISIIDIKKLKKIL
jgi:CRP/FNR family transcriptional regulator, cyclic AMP receptor protein